MGGSRRTGHEPSGCLSIQMRHLPTNPTEAPGQTCPQHLALTQCRFTETGLTLSPTMALRFPPSSQRRGVEARLGAKNGQHFTSSDFKLLNPASSTVDVALCFGGDRPP